jgi:hypothetical protein
MPVMKMKALLTLALACGLAGAAAAAQMTGTVVSVDPQSVTLRYDDGTEMRHPVAPGIEVRGPDGGVMRPAELVNRRVQIEIDEAQRVTSIEVADASDDAAAATGGTEERAAQAGDPAAPDPAGGEMARAELPDTAGPVALVALIGGALLAAAYATRAYRRR